MVGTGCNEYHDEDEGELARRQHDTAYCPIGPSSASASRQIRARSLRVDCVEAAGLGDALELMFTAVLELDPGSGDEVLEGVGDQDVSGLSERGDAGGDVYGESGEIVASDLALASV
jgi:hypothetical protein